MRRLRAEFYPVEIVYFTVKLFDEVIHRVRKWKI